MKLKWLPSPGESGDVRRKVPPAYYQNQIIFYYKNITITQESFKYYAQFLVKKEISISIKQKKDSSCKEQGVCSQNGAWKG